MPLITGQTPELLQGIHFKVEWLNVTIGFTEVNGLGGEQQVAEYREGTDPFLNMRKIPGLMSYPNLVLKRGITQDNSALGWREAMAIVGAAARLDFRRRVAVHILDRQGNFKRSWAAVNAFPVKWDLADVAANKSDILIETLELTHEGLVPCLAGTSTPLPPNTGF